MEYPPSEPDPGELRKGVKFHNGEVSNAESVKFTIDFVLNPANKALTKTLFERIDRVDIIDDYTVKITTKQPFPTLLENLIEVFMAPPKLAKEKGMGHLATNPVGTGAYKLESWSKDREIRLVKNAGYWKGVPPIDRIEFRIIPEVGPRVSALVVGEVDLIPDVPPHLIQQIKNSGTASVKGVAGRRPIFIALDNISEGPMKDVRVRQALNYGVNVDETTAAEAPTRHAAHREHLGSWTLRITVLFVLLVLSVPPGVAAAHWGGLDRYGCHTDRKAETYHFHVGRFAGHSFESKDALLRHLNAGAVDGQARAVTRPPRTHR